MLAFKGEFVERSLVPVGTLERSSRAHVFLSAILCKWPDHGWCANTWHTCELLSCTCCHEFFFATCCKIESPTNIAACFIPLMMPRELVWRKSSCFLGRRLFRLWCFLDLRIGRLLKHACHLMIYLWGEEAHA